MEYTGLSKACLNAVMAKHPALEKGARQ